MDSQRPLYRARYLVQPDSPTNNNTNANNARRFDLRRDSDRIAKITHSRMYEKPQRQENATSTDKAEKPSLEALELDYMMIKNTLKTLEERVALQEQTQTQCKKRNISLLYVQRQLSSYYIYIAMVVVCLLFFQLFRLLITYLDKEEAQLKRELGPGLYRDGWLEYSTILF